MTPITKSGAEFDPAAVERAEWRAQRDLGAPVPGAHAGDAATVGRQARGRGAEVGDGRTRGGGAEAVAASTWGLAGFDPEGHWRRWLRDGHPPRFRAPGGIEVGEVKPGAAESFAATTAFGLHLSARAEAAFAALPGKPGWRCYLTRTGSSPAALATFADGPIVLLAADASAAVGRRSPAHLALLHRAIGDAIESGARLIGARIDEEDAGRDAAAGLLLAGFEKSYRCPLWVDAGLPAS